MMRRAAALIADTNLRERRTDASKYDKMPGYLVCRVKLKCDPIDPHPTSDECQNLITSIEGKGKGKRYRYMDLYSALDNKHLVLEALRHGDHTV